MLKWRLLVTSHLCFCACDIWNKYLFFQKAFNYSSKTLTVLWEWIRKVFISCRCVIKEAKERKTLYFLAISVLLNERESWSKLGCWTSGCLLGLCISAPIANSFQDLLRRDQPRAVQTPASQGLSAGAPGCGPKTAFRQRSGRTLSALHRRLGPLCHWIPWGPGKVWVALAISLWFSVGVPRHTDVWQLCAVVASEISIFKLRIILPVIAIPFSGFLWR